MNVVFIRSIFQNTTESFLKRVGHVGNELLKNKMCRFAEDMSKQTHCIQWCPDISPGPVQTDNETIRGVGQKAVHLPLRSIWLK